MTPGQGPGLTVQEPGQRQDSKDYLTLKHAAYEASIQRQPKAWTLSYYLTEALRRSQPTGL